MTAFSQDLDADLIEWVNPVGTTWIPVDSLAAPKERHQSQMEVFESFLNRSRQYPTLVLDGGPQARTKKVIVVEDAPFLPHMHDQVVRFVVVVFFGISCSLCAFLTHARSASISRGASQLLEAWDVSSCFYLVRFLWYDLIVLFLCDSDLIASESTSSIDYILGDLRHSYMVGSIAMNPTNTTLLVKASRGEASAHGPYCN